MTQGKILQHRPEWGTAPADSRNRLKQPTEPEVAAPSELDGDAASRGVEALDGRQGRKMRPLPTLSFLALATGSFHSSRP
ncbi:hypothetical protein HPB50_026588 [Hyalomma asiaticum]|uniref:Uncharacterized protein n=1 Tax=Hyalomma asiaticum TaxID=266040 RepID=A0ACB7T2G2_HYAAI|nr:hypothetical protein HPB50_026588 [Hyalomma asiaticum]